MMAPPQIGLDDARITNHIARRPFGQHFAEVQHDRAVDQRHDNLHDMLDHHHGDAARTDLLDQLDTLRLEPRGIAFGTDQRTDRATPFYKLFDEVAA